MECAEGDWLLMRVDVMGYGLVLSCRASCHGENTLARMTAARGCQVVFFRLAQYFRRAASEEKRPLDFVRVILDL